jgi:hypothetical protein
MQPEAQPAAENIRFIQQGIRLIRRLDDTSYTRPAGVSFRGGVGAQFRHCFDFYGCFLSGVASAEVDYCARERDARVEIDRTHAIVTAERIVERLRRLGPECVEDTLGVRVDSPASAEAGLSWSRSTVLRELQFLVSHTIHHYALIVSLLELQNVELGSDLADFGIAPSTLAHWKEAGPVTS